MAPRSMYVPVPFWGRNQFDLSALSPHNMGGSAVLKGVYDLFEKMVDAHSVYVLALLFIIV